MQFENSHNYDDTVQWKMPWSIKLVASFTLWSAVFFSTV